MKCSARTFSSWSFPMIAIFALAACGSDDKQPKSPDSQQSMNGGATNTMATTAAPVDTTPAPTAATPPPEMPPAKPAEAMLTDEQIVAIATTANDGEVQLAKLALTKAKNAKVKQFATHMQMDHMAALKKEQAMLTSKKMTASDNAMSMQLKSDAQSTMESLKTMAGADFDKAYMDSQVKMHQQVLDLIDNKMIPAAKDADLKAELQAIRPKIAEHLKMASDIQASLGTTTGNQKGPSSGSH
jgi:putative membrane protein